MKVVFSDNAKQDLREIRNWIAGDNPRRAATFVRELAAAARSLGKFPQRYNDLDRGLYRMPHGNYLILYRVNNRIDVLHIVHSARDVTNLLDDPT